MKNKISALKCCLAMLLSFFLATAIFTVAMAEQSRNIFCDEADAITSIAAWAGKLYVLRYEGLFEYTDGEMNLVSAEISADYRRENSVD